VKQKVELGNAVLKGVSRSFYLSIRLLPRLMREPVSIGYLLARASDTLADTEKVPAKLRMECLDLFLDALKNDTTREELLEMISSRFVQYQTNPKEKLLLEKLSDVFDWYDTVREWAWADIAEVMKPIVAGQKWDVQYFGIDKNKQIKSEKDLDTYCYQVAGSVGEFWGNVGQHAYKRFTTFTDDILKIKGVRYGKGLQLINILRDLPEDLEQGRCYLPDVSTKDTEKLLESTKKFRTQAREYLEQGLEYSTSLRQKRSRIATALPALIGLKTLDLMDEATWEDWQAGIKITRKEVRKCLWKAMTY